MMTTRDAATRHVPVLRDRVVQLLTPACTGAAPVLLDATLGMGGHTEAMLAAVPTLQVIGIDRDEQALALARARLARWQPRVRFAHAPYSDLAVVLDELQVPQVDAILFDLGVSSLQLDDPQRGFAYRFDGPLDMRMDRSGGLTAEEVLATYSEQELTRVLRDFGEERYAGRIARAIVRERAIAPLTSSARLVDIVGHAIPAAAAHAGSHPAKRTFQALRIEVNGELASWQSALPQAIARLAVGGRLVVLSYHSLEDRIAKQTLTAGARDTSPVGLPVELADHAPYLRLLVRGAETAAEAEVADNPRAASVRLRAAERIRPGGGRS